MSELTSKEIDIQAIPPPLPTQWVRHLRYETIGEEEFNIPERYAILLVLEGSLRLTFKKDTSKEIAAKSLVVIDRKQLSHASWEAGTAILEFTPPEKIFRFFKSCNRAFSIPCSTIVPVHSELQQWVNDLMIDSLKPASELDETLRRDYCLRLSGILNGYPPLLVSELLVAFQACSMIGEKQCRGEKCK